MIIGQNENGQDGKRMERGQVGMRTGWSGDFQEWGQEDGDSQDGCRGDRELQNGDRMGWGLS